MPRFLRACLPAALALLAAAAWTEAAAPRAAWIWEADAADMLRSGRAARRAVKFLKKKGIGEVYLYADAYGDDGLLAAKPKLYRKLVRRLRAGGIGPFVLLGSWRFRTHEYVLPERRAEARAMFGRVLAYNASSRPEERFDGVNLDIEPHALEAWKTGKESLLVNFLDLGRELMAAKEAAGAAMRVGPAIPFWLDGVELEWSGVSKPASEHVLDVYDYAALMDYRNAAGGEDGMIAHAASELAYAAKAGKKLVIGVEVTPNEVEKVSFASSSEEALERELALAGEAFAASPAFGGFALHHFGSYRAWLERREE